MVSTTDVHADVDGKTVASLLRRNAEEFAEYPALSTGVGPDDRTISWGALRDQVRVMAYALRELGVRPGDRVLIMASKRPEHWITDLATVHLGAIPCTVYDTVSSSEVDYMARHSAASVVLLEGTDQLERWREALRTSESVRHVVLLEPSVVPTEDARFIGYPDARALGEQAHDPRAFEEWVDAINTDQPLCMIYTSGTTGPPKGVVLSHRNVLYEVSVLEHLMPAPAHARVVSYLPLAHVAERVLGIYAPVFQAGHVTICPDQTQLLETLAATAPHGFFGVPRVWEKIAAGLQAKVAAMPEPQRTAIDQAREATLRAQRLRGKGLEVPEDLVAQVAEADRSVLAPIRAALGLAESVRNCSGAAPIPVSVLEVLAGFGLEVLEVWGLSETTGCATVSTPEINRPGAVGAPAPGMQVTLADDFEVLVRGPVVFLGYLREDGVIEPNTDEHGWFATGDIGTFADGLLTITDRKKEIIITAGGKNVAPSTIEGLLRSHSLVAQAVAIGDRRPYLTALLVLDSETVPAWAQAHGLETTELAKLAEHPELHRELDAALEKANGELARAEQIKYYQVIGTPWTAESGELTPTLKLRRKVIESRYSADIERLYQQA